MWAERLTAAAVLWHLAQKDKVMNTCFLSQYLWDGVSHLPMSFHFAVSLRLFLSHFISVKLECIFIDEKNGEYVDNTADNVDRNHCIHHRSYLMFISFMLITLNSPISKMYSMSSCFCVWLILGVFFNYIK